MDLNTPLEIKIDETEDFKIFEKEIDYLIGFFRSFSELILLNGRTISFIFENNYFTLDRTLIDSSGQTLQSIKLCSSIGSFSDANTLIRKLRDDLFQYLYILNVINLHNPFVEEDLQSLKIDNPENFAESFMNLRFNNYYKDDEKAVAAWFNNSVSDLPKQLKKKLEFENYMTILKNNTNISKILIDYQLEKYWDTLRRRLNDYVHNNGEKFSTQNYIKANDKYLVTHLNNINVRTSYVSTFFIIALLMIDSSLFSSTDYIDYLECGMKPPECSQYLIAPFLQEFIDMKIVKLHPELKQYIRDNNIHGMKIE